ncbi:hypothetical protein, partial [Salmonella bongori]|uniref:hypothetical protein n=1 Tax=Salmonella bongori TaxID=54736 RepID=UPI00241E0BD3
KQSGYSNSSVTLSVLLHYVSATANNRVAHETLVCQSIKQRLSTVVILLLPGGIFASNSQTYIKSLRYFSKRQRVV